MVNSNDKVKLLLTEVLRLFACTKREMESHEGGEAEKIVQERQMIFSDELVNLFRKRRYRRGFDLPSFRQRVDQDHNRRSRLKRLFMEKSRALDGG